MIDSKLQQWALENKPADDLIYKQGYWDQIMFMRDTLTPLVSVGLKRPKKDEPRIDITNVISTHMSKSVTLPVLEFSRVDLGLRLIMRNNFYNWKLSVMSEKPIKADFTGLFYESSPREPEYTGNCLSSCYFEGFPKSLVFGYRGESTLNWSAEIYGKYDMYTTLWLIMKSMEQIKPMIQHTKEEHKKALDEEYGR